MPRNFGQALRAAEVGGSWSALGTSPDCGQPCPGHPAPRQRPARGDRIPIAADAAAPAHSAPAAPNREATGLNMTSQGSLHQPSAARLSFVPPARLDPVTEPAADATD